MGEDELRGIAGVKADPREQGEPGGGEHEPRHSTRRGPKRPTSRAVGPSGRPPSTSVWARNAIPVVRTP